MTVRKLAKSAIEGSRRTFRRIRESSTFFPPLLRKPRIMLRCLTGALGAQIALIATVVVMTVIAPTLLDWILNKVYPDSIAGAISGLFGGRDESTKRDVARVVIQSVMWCIGGGLSLLLVWLRIPDEVGRAAENAREHEATADALAASDPLKSIAHYESAIALVCEMVREAALKAKIDEVERSIPAMVAAPGGGALERDNANAAGPRTIAGRYAIVSELGRGANGVVYKADDVILRRQVALKELAGSLSVDDSPASRFRQEARVLAQLNHPFIVQVFDLVEESARLWMAMELVEGGDLATRLREKGRLPVTEATLLGRRMAEAVAFAHDRGVVHRDLKPLNVMLADEQTPKITDFGLAKFKGSSVHTVEGTVMGSPHYMSPEQADARPVDASSDIYSLGAVFYHMLTGSPPFEGELSSVLVQHIRRPAPSMIKSSPDLGIPRRLDQLVLRMLSKKPSQRPASMNAVAAELAQISHECVPNP